MSSCVDVSFGDLRWSLDPEWAFGHSFCSSGWECRGEGEWLPAADPRHDPFAALGTADNTVQHFHGTTLSQARYVHQEGFRVSRAAHGCPPGIWGLTSQCFPEYARGHALEHCRLNLGWLEPPLSGADLWLNAWTCPVVLEVRLPEYAMKKVKTLGQPAVSMQCFKGGGFLQQGELFRVAGRHHFEVHIHMPTFLNYQNARPEYGALRDGTKVMCQCRLGAPQDVLGPERGVPCGAVAVYPPPADWIKSNRGSWVCHHCNAARLAMLPLSHRPVGEQVTCEV